MRVAHAPGMPGTFSPPPTSKELASYRSRHASRHVRGARAVMHVGIDNPRWRGKRSRHSRRMRNPKFCVSGKRPMGHALTTPLTTSSSLVISNNHTSISCISHHITHGWNNTPWFIDIYQCQVAKLLARQKSCFLLSMHKIIYIIVTSRERHGVSNQVVISAVASTAFSCGDRPILLTKDQ